MIYLYSSTILSFRKKVKQMALYILNMEVKTFTGPHHFLWGHYTYPLEIVVFEDTHQLGFFDSTRNSIGINKVLMYKVDDEALRNIIRHELAHYLVFIIYGDVPSHGKEFHHICARFGWGQEVFKAYTDLSAYKGQNSHQKHKKILEKIKKVLALSSSSNPHESQLATVKANELLLRYNLQYDTFDADEDTCLKRVLTATRRNAKITCIYDILETFFVQPVLNTGGGTFYLEVLGRRSNVELAEYVAHFLDHELDHLWQKHRQLHPHLKGITMKNSFFRGLSEGYLQKINSTHHQSFSTNELMIVKQGLQKHINAVYGRLSKTRTTYSKTDTYSKNLGKSAGQNLSIRKGINDSKNEIKELSY